MAMSSPVTEYRQEKDSIGVKNVPADAYYGVQALRGHENFPISGFTPAQVYPEAIRAFGWIKKAAAHTNMDLGLLDKLDEANNDAMGKALMEAADEMIAGKFNDDFIVDVYQGGTGTSNHMNANEILANRATEILGGKKGEYRVHPNDHANYGQSTNDVTPTVLRLTFLQLHTPLMESLRNLEATLHAKKDEFANVLIPGRTHMQDAVPMTLGQVFGGYTTAIRDAIQMIDQSSIWLYEIGLGGSAVGTGLNTHVHYRETVTRYLRQYSGIEVKQARDYFQIPSSFGHFAIYHSALRNLALELEKLSHDLKLYSSGPKTAIGELKLPDKQPGSSIMPGKINPIYPELINQLSYIVQGNDVILGLCVQNGQWQLNVMMPTILIKMVESQRILTNGCRVFADECIAGITPNTEMVERRMNYSTILLTALNPHIGYEAAAKIAKRVIGEGKTVREVVLEEGITDHHGNRLDDARLDEILSVSNMTQPV